MEKVYQVEVDMILKDNLDDLEEVYYLLNRNKTNLFRNRFTKKTTVIWS